MTLHPVAVGVIVAIAAMLLIAIPLIIFLRRRKRHEGDGAGNLATALQNLNQTIQQGQTQIATLTEKVSHIEPITQTIGGMEVELRGLSERVLKVEQNQTVAYQGIGSLATGLAQTGASLASKVGETHHQSVQSLYQVSSGLAGEMTRIQKDLAALQASVKAREEMEQRTAESVRRLESIIAGTQSKGSAGENILDAVFAKLPADWQVRNFRVGGKHVEFGLRLPNNLILPIDSKWAATDLLEQFAASSDTDEQLQLKAEIEYVVVQKAKEVRKYIDPSVTVSFGVAVVPDAVYNLCGSIQAEVFKMNVVVMSYSLFIPYLLLVFQTILKAGQSIDLQKLDAHLQAVQGSITALQEELDGRFSRAITMLNNSRDEMRAYLGKANSSLTSLQIGTTGASTAPALPESEGEPDE